MRITLTVTAGPHRGQRFTFVGHDMFLVGRSRRAHFRLPSKDKFFSRAHFLVEINPPKCRLMDMDSHNGTYVNGAKVKIIDLKDGDVIQAGRTLLRVSVEVPATLPVIAPEAMEPVPATPAPSATPAPPATQATLHLSRQTAQASVVREAAGRPPSQPVQPCRVCMALAVTDDAPQPEERPGPHGWALCPACQEAIRGQEQPIPGYQILRELGRGGMGIVHMALRVQTGALVALKTINPAVAGTRSQVERFLREANILRELDHPQVVAFRDMGEAEGFLYFAMDYVHGLTAGQILKHCGPLPIRRAVDLICQLLEALEYAHAKKFVHRDIKPANLLVTQVRGRETIKLADFGLARVYHASHFSGLTLVGDMGGTVAFMAPEQITQYRQAKPPVDQYAAGATLYNLLTQQFTHDFPRQSEKRLLKILQEDAIPIQQRRPDIPDALAEIIHKALAKAARARFADVGEMRNVLLPFRE